MLQHNKKGEGISLPLATVIALILFLTVVAVNIYFAALVKDSYDDTEFLNCKLAIDISQGVKVEKSFAGLTGSLQPFQVECEPIILNSTYFEKAENEKQLSVLILDKMRLAWWTTGRGQYKNVWNDILAGDSVCKAMYYFRLDDILGEEKGVPKTVDRSLFVTFLETAELPEIQKSLADYMQESAGFGNKYFVALDAEGIKDDVLYGIFISSATNGFNSVILSEVNPRSLDETKKDINEKVEATTGRKNVCTEMVAFGNKVQRFWVI